MSSVRITLDKRIAFNIFGLFTDYILIDEELVMVDLDNKNIYIKGSELTKQFESMMKYIKDPHTGIKRFDDNDAETVIINIGFIWYKCELESSVRTTAVSMIKFNIIEKKDAKDYFSNKMEDISNE